MDDKPKRLQVRCRSTGFEHTWSNVKTVRQKLMRPLVCTNGDAPYVAIRYRRTVMCESCDASYDAPISCNNAELNGASKMNDEQAWFAEQSYSFRMGFQDYRGGEQFDSRRNAEWQCGWKWANNKGVSRNR